MTKILHYVSSIEIIKDNIVWVKFMQIASNDQIVKYIEELKKSWEHDGMPGELPKDMAQRLKEQRFNNEFEMKFPFVEWTKRDLKIFDQVIIDMPLQLSDIKDAKPTLGV